MKNMNEIIMELDEIMESFGFYVEDEDYTLNENGTWSNEDLFSTNYDNKSTIIERY